MALLAVVCDHPAMCKMGGFADHSHNEAPCNKCHVDQASIFSDESLQNRMAFLSNPDAYHNLFYPEFPPRTSEDHRRNCFKEHSLETDGERDDFFKKHGARWTELARLPYFDLVRCMIIDPMHNLFLGLFLTLFSVVLTDPNVFLGIVKTLWYSQWIQTSALRKSTDKRARELDVIHRFLATVCTSLTCTSMTSSQS